MGELEERFPKKASSYRLMGTEIKIQNELLSQSCGRFLFRHHHDAILHDQQRFARTFAKMSPLCYDRYGNNRRTGFKIAEVNAHLNAFPT